MMTLAAALISAPVTADPINEDHYFSAHAQGCMLLRECTDHVQELKTVTDLNKDSFPDVDYSIVADEFDFPSDHLTRSEPRFFLDQRYFPVGHRGVYHTVSTTFECRSYASSWHYDVSHAS